MKKTLDTASVRCIVPLIQQRAEDRLAPLRAIDALRRASLDLTSFESLDPVKRLLRALRQCEGDLCRNDSGQ